MTAHRSDVAVLGIGVAAAALAAVLLGRLDNPRQLWLLVVATAALALVPLVVALKDGAVDPFEPIHLFAVSFLVIFVLRPVADLRHDGGIPSWLGWDVRPGYASALAVGALGATGFYLGYYRRAARRVAARLPLPPQKLDDAVVTGYVLTAVLACGALLGIFVAARGADAVLSLFDGRSTSRLAAVTNASGYLYTAPLWLTSLGILLVAVAPRGRRTPLVFGLALVVASQASNIAGGNRSWVLPAALALVALFYLRRGTRPSTRTLLLLAAVVFFVGITVPREHRVGDDDMSLASVTRTVLSDPGAAVAEFVDGPDTGMVDNLAVELIHVPGRVGYQYGATYANALAKPVPRDLWPSKPYAADDVLMQQIWPEFAERHVGFSFSFFGEPYLNFGFPGVFLVAALFGVAARTLWEWYRRDPANGVAIALFVANWPFLFVYMRGGLGVDYHRHVMSVAPLLLAVALSGVRARRRALPRPVRPLPRIGAA